MSERLIAVHGRGSAQRNSVVLDFWSFCYASLDAASK